MQRMQDSVLRPATRSSVSRRREKTRVLEGYETHPTCCGVQDRRLHSSEAPACKADVHGAPCNRKRGGVLCGDARRPLAEEPRVSPRGTREAPESEAKGNITWHHVRMRAYTYLHVHHDTRAVESGLPWIARVLAEDVEHVTKVQTYSSDLKLRLRRRQRAT